MNDKFIEYDLPLGTISEESAREKSIRHGHISTFHIWWARRPLAATRATTFAALIDDPGPGNQELRNDIWSTIQDISTWESVKNGNSSEIEEAQSMLEQQYDEPPTVLDPFAGGGSIPLEALRLGCHTYSSDYNPVAVFIQKAAVEWTDKFCKEVSVTGDIDTGDEGQATLSQANSEQINPLTHLVDKWSDTLLTRANDDIGQFYPTDSSEELVGEDKPSADDGWIPVGYLWVRTIPCKNPNCDAPIPLARQFWLCKKDDKRIAYKPEYNEQNNSIDYSILHGDELEKAIEDGFDPSDGTVTQANAECIHCNQVTESDEVRRSGKDGELDEELVAVAFHHPDESGKKYRLANSEDKDLISEYEKFLQQEIDNWPYLETPVPDEDISTYELRRIAPPLYGMSKWRDLFNTRQNLSILTFVKHIKESYDEIEADCESLLQSVDNDKLEGDAEDLAEATMGYLSVILSRYLDYSSTLCVWVPSGEFVAHTFGRQAIQMTWDYFEVNPFSGSTGDWDGAKEWVLRYLNTNSWDSDGTAIVNQESALNLSLEDGAVDYVITDPPYYDNVPYAALSDFFYVWLKRAIGDQFPDLFSTSVVPKSEEIVHDRPHELSDSQKTKEYFEEKLGEAFKESYRVLKPGGVALFVYAHKTTDGWETMLNALVNANFVVTGSWPIHTERKSRLGASRNASLASSIYMVCRKQERQSVGYWSEIKPDIQDKIEGKLEQFWENGIVGGDFFISAIGPGMEEFSKYERVETYSGERVSTEELLQYIRSVSTDFLVERLLQDASSERIDEPAMFYLTYRWTYLDNKVDFDDAKKLANAEGVDLEQLWDSDGFVKKTRKYIHVHGPKKRDEIDRIDNMVDAVHKAALLWEEGEKDELGEFLSTSGYGDTPAFWQFCQAIAECLVNGTKEKQLLEGLLMSREEYTDYSPSQKDTTLEDFATEGGEQ